MKNGFKVIDMEHHFFHPAFIETLKTRKEYPKWQEGFGVMYSKSAALPIGLPASSLKLNYIKDVKAVDLITDFDETRIKYMDHAGITCAALSTSAGIETLSREDVEFVKKLPISPEDREKILYKNAEKYILGNNK